MRYLLAGSTALLLLLTFPGPDLAFLAPVALTPLLVALGRESRLRQRFLLGYLAGFIYWAGICYWIQFVLEVHGDMGFWGSWGTFALFCLIKALYVGAFAALTGLAIGQWWAAPAIAALWTVMERTHAWGSIGFSWFCLGNAGIDMSVPMRLAPYTGVYGLSFLFALLAAVLAGVWLRRPRRQMLWLAPLALLPLLPPLDPDRRGDAEAVMVQPDVQPGRRWSQQEAVRLRESLVRLSALGALATPGRPVDLILWPELPAPVYYFNDAQLRDAVGQLARSADAPVLLGTVAYEESAPLNSAVLVDRHGEAVARYDKVNLVPFGEYVPPLFDWVNRITQEGGDFRPGTKPGVAAVDGHTLGVFICYESVFPDFVRRYPRDGAEVLVNISNDAYFGKSVARYQHLKIARMRAAENRRWLLRATNDGVTAVIDPTGRIRETLEPNTEGFLRAHFEYLGETTFYARYGDWFVLLCLAIALAGLACGGLLGRRAGRGTQSFGG